jgi:hypothetical protein
MMRSIILAFFLALILIASVSANPVEVVGLCGFFDNPYPNSTASGSFTCPTAASLGITDVTSEYVVYDSDYSNGVAASVNIQTMWSFSGVTLAFSSDTTTVTGSSSSTGVVSSDGLALNAFVAGPPSVLAGFYDVVTSLGTPTVSYSNAAFRGAALQATGYAEVVYVSSPVPEPNMIPMVAAAASLLAVCWFRGRKSVTV